MSTRISGFRSFASVRWISRSRLLLWRMMPPWLPAILLTFRECPVFELKIGPPDDLYRLIRLACQNRGGSDSCLWGPGRAVPDELLQTIRTLTPRRLPG